MSTLNLDSPDYLLAPGIVVHELGHLAAASVTRVETGGVVLFSKNGSGVLRKGKLGIYQSLIISLSGSTANLVAALLAIYLMPISPILAFPLLYLALVNLDCCHWGITPVSSGDGFNFLCDIYLLRFPRKLRRYLMCPAMTSLANWVVVYKKRTQKRRRWILVKRKEEKGRFPKMEGFARFLAIPFFTIWFVGLNFLSLGLLPVLFFVFAKSLSL